MAGITLAQAESRLTDYLAAEAKILLGQSVSIDGQTLTRANLDAVRSGISYWDKQVKSLTQHVQGYSRARTVVPHG